MKGEVRRAQISIEYLVVIGVVLLLIIIPAAVFLTSFAQGTVGDRVTQDQINRLGEGLVQASEQVYYLGVFSQRQTTLPTPRNLQVAHAVAITQDDKEFYYFVLQTTQQGELVNHVYQTRAPIQTQQEASSHLLAQCETLDCTSYELLTTGGGQRTFDLRNIREDGQLVVEIKTLT